jgi:hypothetical protein
MWVVVGDDTPSIKVKTPSIEVESLSIKIDVGCYRRRYFLYLR